MFSWQTFVILMNKEPGGLNLLWNVFRLSLYNQSLTNLFNLSNEVFISLAKRYLLRCKKLYNFIYVHMGKYHQTIHGWDWQILVLLINLNLFYKVSKFIIILIRHSQTRRIRLFQKCTSIRSKIIVNILK